MSEYEQRTTINAEPAQVFDFISDIGNLPSYLPTVNNAMPQQGDRVRVQGEAAGHRYDSDGFYNVDRDQMRMDWGSDGENQYRGWMEVTDADSGSACEVTVHLSFEPRPDMAEKFEQQSGSRDRTINEGLQNALQSIKNQCEGNGGKVESRAATGHGAQHRM